MPLPHIDADSEEETPSGTGSDEAPDSNDTVATTKSQDPPGFKVMESGGTVDETMSVSYLSVEDGNEESMEMTLEQSRRKRLRLPRCGSPFHKCNNNCAKLAVLITVFMVIILSLSAVIAKQNRELDSMGVRGPLSVTKTPSSPVGDENVSEQTPDDSGMEQTLDDNVMEQTPDDIDEEQSLPPIAYCGCQDCSEEVWDDTDAAGSSCGSRITWLLGNDARYPTEQLACQKVAGQEYPGICGLCDPDSCVLSDPSQQTPGTPFSNSASNGDTDLTLTPETSLYCFPEYADRTRLENVWGKNFVVEVKENDIGLCGPSNNKFSTSTVSTNADNDLVLQFKKVGSTFWHAGEVRVMLPEGETYAYGTYSFSVKSIAVMDMVTKQVVDTKLPPSVILGLFTWDDTEDYASNENWNHEVDIEISQWGKEGDADAQFLIQPWTEDPQKYRFYTGADSTYDQAGHTYEFTWNPGVVSWSTDAGGADGQDFTYATEQTIQNGWPDRVQCLPADLDVRLNLWHLNGNVRPNGILSDTHMVQVVIDDFSFTPSGLTSVATGGPCTKHCQCAPTSFCQDNKCTAR